jgi:hypothetical protein
MLWPRAVVAGTVGILLLVTVASGPLVGLELTSEASEFDPGTGNLNVTVESVPDSGTLQQASHGAGTHHIRVDPVRLQIHAITGQPMVAYQLYVPALDHTRTSVHFLDAERTGAYDLPLDPSQLDPDRIDEDVDSYDATISVVVRDGDGERVIAEADLELEV